MFAFGGLWETWKVGATGQKLRTYTVLTTDPNELVEPIHNRMPVILHRRDYERWLAPADAAHLAADLLSRFPLKR
jgi:putative SOS response-associated peptidase YedK